MLNFLRGINAGVNAIDPTGIYTALFLMVCTFRSYMIVPLHQFLETLGKIVAWFRVTFFIVLNPELLITSICFYPRIEIPVYLVI